MSRPIDRAAAHTAAMLRRSGYPDATPLPEYCIDGEIGPDRIYTETISIHVGDYQPNTIPERLRRLVDKP